METTSRPGARRVVIVEDDLDAGDALREVLTVRGMDVSVATDGAAGCALIIALKPDVALIDLGLPGMDGYRVAETIRSRPDLAETRLVAVTGRGSETVSRVLSAGFDGQLTKPFVMEQLEEVLS